MYKGNFKLMLHEFRPSAAFRLSWEEYDCIGKEIFISLWTILYLTGKEKQFPFFLINNFKKYSYYRLWIFSGFIQKHDLFIFVVHNIHAHTRTCTHTCTHAHTNTHSHILNLYHFPLFLHLFSEKKDFKDFILEA